jgi:RimJ/RimL family protein N-acetyltransferase
MTDFELRPLRCLVRAFRVDDAPSLAQHANNRKVWLNLRDLFPHPYTETHAAGYIAHVLKRAEPLSFAIDVDGAAVGSISLRRGEDIERHSAELGYWLGEDFWGRGITTDAIRSVTMLGFAKHDLIRIFAVPFARNAPSCRVLEKAGYAREGLMRQSAVKDGVVEDQYLYAALRDEYVAWPQ